jgi:hypothetical protein
MKLGIGNSLGNPTYTLTTLTKEEILDNHRSVLYSFGISAKDLELDLPSLYWISKLHKCPYIVRGLVDGNKNIFVMEERQVFTLTLVYIKCNSLGFLRKNIEVSDRFI